MFYKQSVLIQQKIQIRGSWSSGLTTEQVDTMERDGTHVFYVPLDSISHHFFFLLLLLLAFTCPGASLAHSHRIIACWCWSLTGQQQNHMVIITIVIGPTSSHVRKVPQPPRKATTSPFHHCYYFTSRERERERERVTLSTMS